MCRLPTMYTPPTALMLVFGLPLQPDTLIARTDTRELDHHLVQTLWWGIFNNPEERATTPCGVADPFVAAVEPQVLAGVAHQFRSNRLPRPTGHTSNRMF